MVFLDFAYEITANTLGNFEKHSCNSVMNYNYDDIFYDKIAKDNEQKFNCSVPFHPLTTSEATGSPIKICRDSTIGKKAFTNWKDSLDSLPGRNKPCSGVDLFLGVPFVNHNRSDDEAFIRIYIKLDIKVKSLILYYDWTTLLAEVGGYIGLFLGVSLIDLTMMLTTALFNVVIMRPQNKNEHIHTSQ